jgi:hypothetical protein
VEGKLPFIFERIDRLKKALISHDEYTNELTTDYQKIRQESKAYLLRYKSIQKFYHTGRNKFQRSIKLMTEKGHNVGKALNCKGMREHFINALGSVCYSDFSTYHTFYVAWLLISSGFVLFLLYLVKLLDVVSHSVEGGEQLGFELGGL